MGSQEVLNETRNNSDKKLEEDGAIDLELYNNKETKYKIVHLLKEPNGETKNGSIVEAIWRNNINCNGTVNGQQHEVTARRSYCILNEFPLWDEICKNENGFADALKKSAIVNLSPEPGDSSTSYKRLEQLAEKWYKRWYEQKLKELKPNIVICGGTFWVAIKQIAGASDNSQQASTGMDYFWDKDLEAMFLNCWHPAFRSKHTVEYCYFRKSSKDIIMKRGLEKFKG